MEILFWTSVTVVGLLGLGKVVGKKKDASTFKFFAQKTYEGRKARKLEG